MIMSLLQKLFGCPRPPRQNLDEARMVVVDVETTGLDPRRDKLLSIGYVPASVRGIELGQLRELVLQHSSENIDKDNIVVHGITPTESAYGRETVEALEEFLEEIGDSWMIAFHADFDREVLRRALKRHLGKRLCNPFIDLAWMLPLLFPEQASLRTLDDWLEHFQIESPYRHRADADALVTAELLLIAMHAARKQGFNEITRLARETHAQGRLTQMGYNGSMPL